MHGGRQAGPPIMIGRPFQRTSPAVTSSKPARQLINVDLPAPTRPVTTTSEPRCTANETALSCSVPSRDTHIPSSSIARSSSTGRESPPAVGTAPPGRTPLPGPRPRRPSATSVAAARDRNEAVSEATRHIQATYETNNASSPADSPAPESIVAATSAIPAVAQYVTAANRCSSMDCAMVAVRAACARPADSNSNRATMRLGTPRCTAAIPRNTSASQAITRSLAVRSLAWVWRTHLPSARPPTATMSTGRMAATLMR